MFIGGLNWETTDGMKHLINYEYVQNLINVQNLFEIISLNLVKSLNALSCAMDNPDDREASGS
jgi:hypothetical protein